MARVAAVPSATLRVGLGERELAAVRWGEILRLGRSSGSSGVRIELVAPEQNWVRATVVDEATGEPVPCRIHFRSAQGIPFGAST